MDEVGVGIISVSEYEQLLSLLRLVCIYNAYIQVYEYIVYFVSKKLKIHIL